MIHARLEGVSRTLVMTLRARASEHNHDDRLFADPWSHEWYQWMPNYPDYDAWYTPAFELASNIRTAIIDDITKTFIEDHDNPVIVEIGGGLSSRPYRVGLESAQWIIVDLPPAINIRHKIDSQNDNLMFISETATSINWFNRLPETDKKDYLFIAEGVLMFIEKKDVQDIIDHLRAYFTGATFVFDTPRESYVEREQDNFTKLNAEIQFYMDEHDFKGYGIKEQKIDYLLTAEPSRWQELDIDHSLLTKEHSGFVATTSLPKP